MKKMDVRVRKTYQLLFDALKELLREKSFEELSVLEICETAGIHRATFYKHFVDKYDFLDRYFRLEINELRFGAPEAEFTPESFRRTTNRLMSNVMAYVAKNNELLCALNDDGHSDTFFNILTNAVSAFFLERMSSHPEVKQAVGNQLPMMAAYYAGGAVGLVKWWSKGEDTCSVQEFVEFIQPRIREFADYLFQKIAQ
ncbi:MAG: TetR family transcriptional regulator [Clostridia bacterium]|nr:TetR family transcriptional regulator [Clostridia bacterium]